MTAPSEVDIGTLIERTPGVYGGRPVLKGTRFPVTLIGILHRQGLSPAEIHRRWLADMDIALVYAGLAYYLANRAAIDTQIAEDAELHDRLAAEHPPGTDRKPRAS
jgi:uncharacterized protein (DUF433 family)